MIRLQRGSLARILHEPLHRRLLDFCEKHTPELMGEPVVNVWLDRMFAGDERLHILIELDESTFKITEHAVIDVQTTAPGQNIVVCHQVQHDKVRLDNIGVGHEYMMKLAAETNSKAIVFFVEKHSKALERKYGYHCARTIMVKSLGSVDTENEA